MGNNMPIKLNESLAYLIGLIVGRGHLNIANSKIIVEFAHKNKYLDGIAYCPKCDYLATKQNDKLVCKKCGHEVDPKTKSRYEQRKLTLESLKEDIIPLVEKSTKGKCSIIGNDHMTLLMIDLNKNPLFNEIAELFEGRTSYDSFEIPRQIYTAERDIKVSFVNGLLYTAGFPAAGGWLNRPGKNGIGRMRVYFQIVRNWKLPVQLCNFLKNEMKLPVHTIDWGHPNIRDSNMNDYFETNPLSWSREHQLKFFPEYYGEFKMLLKHKQAMFDELAAHNKKVGFEYADDCDAPTTITEKSIKPIHPGETDTRIPKEVRKHCDAFWQVCHGMGCIFTNNKIKKSDNSDCYYLAGKDEKCDCKALSSDWEKIRNNTAKELMAAGEKKEQKKEESAHKKIRSNPEAQLYEPISQWLEKALKTKGFKDIRVHDTSSYYLGKWILRNDLAEQFEFCSKYGIKPDIVGFILDDKSIAFVEVKIGELTLKEVGQLLGYCLVANPKYAFLVSKEEPSIHLAKIIQTNPDILKYTEEKKILIGKWDKGQVKVVA